MPNWKKLIVSGSDAALQSLNVTSEFTASGLNYPTTDGDNGDFLLTDGSGNLSFSRSTIFANVKNISGVTLQKGTPVHATGTSGNSSEVVAASASAASTMPATYVLNETLADDAEGLALITGYINGVDTSAFGEGDIIYVGESGGYTNVKPQGSDNLIQNLGIVNKVDASNGSGYVYGSGRSNDVPNLPENKIWVGSSNYTVTSSIVTLDEDNSQAQITGSLTVTTSITGSSAQLTSVPTGTTETDILVVDSNGNVKSRSDLDLTGPTGPTGAKGDKGEVGDTGAKGDKGEVGDTGAKGDKGEVGDTGAKGQKGEVGDTGAKGDKGEVGDTGAKGDKGEVGDTGAASTVTGPTGDKGDKGAVGPSGVPSITGNVDDRVLTATGGASIQGEAGLTYDGTTLTVDSKATIGSGHSNTGVSSSIAGGVNNLLSGEYNIIGGGFKNTGSGGYNSIGGGYFNTNDGTKSVIAGGDFNAICDNVSLSSIVGGSGNTIRRCHSVTISTQNHIGGGTQNFIDGGYGNVIAGGSANYTSGSCSYASILGGTGQKLYGSSYSTTVAGRGNCIVNSSTGYNSIVGGYENELNSSNCSLIVGGLRNCVAGNLSSIVGGRQNEIQEDCSFIGGGYNNQIDGCMDFIGAGQNNCTINTVTGFSNVGRNIIVGGCGNSIDGTRGWNFIGGGYDNAITSSTTIGDHNYANSILGRDNLIDTNTDRNSISGGGNNTIVGENVGNASIAGGVSNCITGATSHIGGGSANTVSGIHSTIAGGAGNTVSAASSSIMGGHYNTVSHTNSHIIGSNITSDKTNYTFVNNLDVEGDAIIGDTLDVGGVVSVDSKINITQLTLTDAATVSWNLANGSNSKITLGGNRTLAISNVAVGDTGTILVQQGSGTTHTLTLPAGSLIIGGATYTTTTTSNGVDVLGFYYDGTNYFWSIPQTATTGAKGDKGEVGDTGAKGQKGEVGDTGAKGQKGEVGDTGGIGDTGAKGDKGEVGPSGVPSITGNVDGYVLTATGGTSINGEQYLIFDSSKRGFCVGSSQAMTGNLNSSILGGNANCITACSNQSTIGGGTSNCISNSSCQAFIGAGGSNEVCADYASIVGGRYNTGSGTCSFIGSGCSNYLTGGNSVIGGGNNNTLTDPGNSFLGGGLNNSLNSGNSRNVLVGGEGNCLTGLNSHAFLGGGKNNYIGGTSGDCYQFLGGGEGNYVPSSYSSIVGGFVNTASGDYSFIGGGQSNIAEGVHSYAGGLESCTAGAQGFAHGYRACATGGASAAFGACTQSPGDNSFVAGGALNNAGAQYSFVGGYNNETTSTAKASSVLGESNCVNAPWSFAVGSNNCILGGNILAVAGGNIVGGKINKVQGTYSLGNLVMGNTNCIGDGSSSVGGAAAFGGGNCILADGTVAIGINNNNPVSGQTGYGCNTLLLGCNNQAHFGENNIVGGTESDGYGTNSIAFGNGATSATGGQQYAFGTGTTNPNNGTVANISNSMVMGRYNVWNITDCHLFAIGNGSSDGSRLNAFNVSHNGRTGLGCTSPQTRLDVNGTTRTTTLVETSARRYKENIVSLQDQLENIKKLEPVEFEWKETKKKDIGLIAEDVEKIYPQLVEHDDNGDVMGVKYSKITSLLVKAIQEQQEQIDQLKIEVKNLKQNK